MTITDIRQAPQGPWPRTATRLPSGEVAIGGVLLTDIADRYGTPTYVFDEATIRGAIRDFVGEFVKRYPRTRVVYAGKALLAPWLVAILRSERIGLDVVSGGELAIGLYGGMPANEISLHGNNKSRQELASAIAAGIGKIIVDNDHEIDLLAELTSDRMKPVTVMIRVNPGVDVHTHHKISTGVADSKFGFPIVDGQAAAAVSRLQKLPGINLVGLHAHVGSQLFESEATTGAIDAMLEFAAEMRAAHGFRLEHFSPGGGFGIAYLNDDEPLPVARWADQLASAIETGCRRHDLDLPTVTIEPGRSIIGPAGVGLYTLGAEKALPGIRTYVSVDGGMADNIRPALYEAQYEAILANRVGNDSDPIPVTIAGKFCESGDILIDTVMLPEPVAGDLLAIPAAGAYTLSMASNYNAAPRPAVVLTREGTATCVRSRETWQDLVKREIVPPHLTT